MVMQPPPIQQPEVPTSGDNQQRASFKIVGLENVNLKNATKVDLRQLEPGQGYVFKIEGWIESEGQYGPYYTIGVTDLNGNLFKFFSNKQLKDAIDNNELQIGNTYQIVMKLKPGMTYPTKNGDQEVRGHIYDIKPYQA